MVRSLGSQSNCQWKGRVRGAGQKESMRMRRRRRRVAAAVLAQTRLARRRRRPQTALHPHPPLPVCLVFLLSNQQSGITFWRRVKKQRKRGRKTVSTPGSIDHGGASDGREEPRYLGPSAPPVWATGDVGEGWSLVGLGQKTCWQCWGKRRGVGPKNPIADRSITHMSRARTYVIGRCPPDHSSAGLSLRRGERSGLPPLG